MNRILFSLVWVSMSLNGMAQWAPICTGGADNNGFVVDFEYFNDTLYATGLFTELCGTLTGPLAKHSEGEWFPADGVPRDGHALEVIDDVLHVATYQFDADSNHVIRYYGDFASALGEGVYYNGADMTPTIYDIVEYDGQIVASGDFNRVGDKDISGIMRWTGTTWDSLGSGLTGFIPGGPPVLYPHNMHVYDGNLYIAGNFGQAGGVTVNGVAMWDGSDWQAMGDGFDQVAYCIGSYQDMVYAGGQFTSSGGSTLKAFAKWNGTAWQSAGFGFSSVSAMDFTFVHTLKVIDDMLFIAGGFDQVVLDDGTIIPCGSVVAWDGDSIHTFGGGIADKDLEAVAPYEDGYLFGGGVFGQGYIAQWTEEETPVSIEEYADEFLVWPNPVSDRLYLSPVSSAGGSYRIKALTGSTLRTGQLTTDGIPVHDLPVGTYLLEWSAPGKEYTHRNTFLRK